jgi:hypothetical protein
VAPSATYNENGKLISVVENYVILPSKVIYEIYKIPRLANQ